MSNLNSRDEPRIQVLKCDVCGDGIEFNADAQVTADTILCHDCIMARCRGESSDLHWESISRYHADVWNNVSSDFERHRRAENDYKYAYSIRAPR